MIRHSEYCGVVDNTTSRAVSYNGASGTKIEASPMELPINPGDGTTFPWLTGIAGRFEKYRFRSLRFRYVPTSSTYYTGSLSMCPIYDPAEQIPTDRRALYNAEGAKQTAVYKPMSITVPARRLGGERFVRLEHQDTIDDNELRLSDVGFIAVALLDVAENNNTLANQLPHAYGNVFVDYEVELISPRVGAKTHKCAHYAHKDMLHICPATSKPSLFSDYGFDNNNRKFGAGSTRGHNVHSTLGLENTYQGPGTYVELASGDDIEYSGFQVKEPFTGYLQLKLDTNGATTPFVPEFWVNGKDDSGNTDLWDLGSASHPIKHPKVKLIDRIHNGIDKAVSTFQVIADAGETIAMGLKNAVTTVEGSAEALWMEADPELLELAGLV